MSLRRDVHVTQSCRVTIILHLSRLFYITSPCITKQIYTKAHQKLPHKRRIWTPGYKPLESLLESDLISSAVDIFAAGSIYVLLLLRKEIFFVQNTPGAGIMELCKLFGAHRVSEVALHLGKTVTIKLNSSSTEREMKDLSDTKEEVIFCRLRSTSSSLLAPNAYGFRYAPLTY